MVQHAHDHDEVVRLDVDVHQTVLDIEHKSDLLVFWIHKHREEVPKMHQ